MVDGGGGFDEGGGIGVAGVFAGVEVAVEAGEVGTGDFEADFVALAEEVAGGPEVDGVLEGLAGGDGLGGGESSVAVFGAEDAFGEVLDVAVGPDVDELGGEVGVGGGGGGEEVERGPPVVGTGLAGS